MHIRNSNLKEHNIKTQELQSIRQKQYAPVLAGHIFMGSSEAQDSIPSLRLAKNQYEHLLVIDFGSQTETL